MLWVFCCTQLLTAIPSKDVVIVLPPFLLWSRPLRWGLRRCAIYICHQQPQPAHEAAGALVPTHPLFILCCWFPPTLTPTPTPTTQPTRERPRWPRLAVSSPDSDGGVRSAPASCRSLQLQSRLFHPHWPSYVFSFFLSLKGAVALYHFQISSLVSFSHPSLSFTRISLW